MNLPEELCVAAQLLRKERALFGAEFEHFATIDPVEILQDRAWIGGSLGLRVFATYSAALEVERLVDVPVRGEEVVHNDKVDLVTAGKFYSMKTIKSREKGVRVVFDMVVIVFEDGEQEFVLRVADGFNDETVVSGKVEEGAGFARGAELGQDVFGGKGQEIVGGVEVEVVFA